MRITLEDLNRQITHNEAMRNSFKKEEQYNDSIPKPNEQLIAKIREHYHLFGTPSKFRLFRAFLKTKSQCKTVYPQ